MEPLSLGVFTKCVGVAPGTRFSGEQGGVDPKILKVFPTLNICMIPWGQWGSAGTSLGQLLVPPASSWAVSTLPSRD